MAYPQSKNQYEPRSIDHFEALEQTIRLRKLAGSGGKYFFFKLAESIEAIVTSPIFRSGADFFNHRLCRIARRVFLRLVYRPFLGPKDYFRQSCHSGNA